MTLQDKLYDKLSQEFEHFIGRLRQSPPDEIIFMAYEKVIKSDILCLFTDSDISDEKAQALLEFENTLDELYQRGTEFSYTHELEESIDEYVMGLVETDYLENESQGSISQTAQALCDIDSMVDARKDIIFHDENYKERFRIKDGESIKITVAYDGEEVIRKCRFLDETHMNVGSTCYHMDEFMEKNMRVGNKYEPIPNQEPKIDIVVAAPGKPPCDIEIPMNLAAMREILGGEPEIVNQDNFSATITGKNGNGIIIVCGISSDNLTSLHPYNAQSKKRELSESISTKDEKPKSFSDKMKSAQIQADEYNAQNGNKKSIKNKELD